MPSSNDPAETPTPVTGSPSRCSRADDERARASGALTKQADTDHRFLTALLAALATRTQDVLTGTHVVSAPALDGRDPDEALLDEVLKLARRSRATWFRRNQQRRSAGLDSFSQVLSRHANHVTTSGLLPPDLLRGTTDSDPLSGRDVLLALALHTSPREAEDPSTMKTPAQLLGLAGEAIIRVHPAIHDDKEAKRQLEGIVRQLKLWLGRLRGVRIVSAERSRDLIEGYLHGWTMRSPFGFDRGKDHELAGDWVEGAICALVDRDAFDVCQNLVRLAEETIPVEADLNHPLEYAAERLAIRILANASQGVTIQARAHGRLFLMLADAHRAKHGPRRVEYLQRRVNVVKAFLSEDWPEVLQHAYTPNPVLVRPTARDEYGFTTMAVMAHIAATRVGLQADAAYIAQVLAGEIEAGSGPLMDAPLRIYAERLMHDGIEVPERPDLDDLIPAVEIPAVERYVNHLFLNIAFNTQFHETPQYEIRKVIRKLKENAATQELLAHQLISSIEGLTHLDM